ncbi:MAG: hypothetical protein H6745_09915 [Deltaproteobacteria bacterium]|nr:hypothetical protein [Deltaproteobacteria bacterium]
MGKAVAATVAAMLVATASSAGARELPENAITLEPLALVFTRTIVVEYERVLSPTFSLFIAPSFTFDSVDTDDLTASFLAVGGGLGARAYLLDDAPTGLFVSAMFQVAWATAERDGAKSDGVGFAVAGHLGYAWVLGGVVAVSVGLGAAWYDMSLTLPDGDVGVSGLYPAARAAIGIGF